MKVKQYTANGSHEQAIQMNRFRVLKCRSESGGFAFSNANDLCVYVLLNVQFIVEQ